MRAVNFKRDNFFSLSAHHDFSDPKTQFDLQLMCVSAGVCIKTTFAEWFKVHYDVGQDTDETTKQQIFNFCFIFHNEKKQVFDKCVKKKLYFFCC